MSRPSPTSSSSSSLPKIAHGRSKLSAKKLWKDHSSIDIYNKGEKGRLNPPEEPPLPVSKNPKPLYRRAVTNPRPFRILHSESNYGMRNTTSLPSLYAQMTFLANAVRNNDGTTSYKGMCVKRRSQTVPSSAPARLEARPEAAGSTDLHWTSASNDKPIPRMLLPTSPGPNSNWFAWKSPRDTDSPPDSPRKERSLRSNVVRTTRSESGIESRSSFLHSVAQKRGQMVVAYKHNGRQHYTLVKPPDPPPQVIKDKLSYTTGSSVISSSYVSYTNSSKSRGEFSVRGVGQGRSANESGQHMVPSSSLVRNPSAKTVDIISEVDGAQDTTHDGYDDGKHPRGDDNDREDTKQVQESQGQDYNTSQDNDNKEMTNVQNISDVKDTKGKGVHFADSPNEESKQNEAASNSGTHDDSSAQIPSVVDKDNTRAGSGTPEGTSGFGIPEDSSAQIPSVEDKDNTMSDSGKPTTSEVVNDDDVVNLDDNGNHSNPTPDNDREPKDSNNGDPDDLIDDELVSISNQGNVMDDTNLDKSDTKAENEQ